MNNRIALATARCTEEFKDVFVLGGERKPFLRGRLCRCCVFATRRIFRLQPSKGGTMHKTYPGMLLPSLLAYR